MTQDELIQQAFAYIKQAQWEPTKWAEAIKNGYNGKPYNYPVTANFKAQQALWDAAHLLPPASAVSLAQKVMFAAWRPEAALRASTAWKIAISADPAFDLAARAAAPKIKAAGHKLAVWGNQDQIGASRIKKLAADVGADYLIFQAETAHEYESAITAGAEVLVGNPNSWSDIQRIDATNRITAGELAVIFETYTNEGAPWPDASSAGGVPVASFCPGVGWGKTPYRLADYKQHMSPEAWAAMCVYLAEDLSDADWAILP